MTTKRTPTQNRRRRPRATWTGPSAPARDVLVWPCALMAGIALLAAAYWLTRAPTNAETSTATETDSRDEARLLLQESLAAYQQLDTYRDQTSLRFRFPVDGQWIEETTELLLQFKRPNKIRIELRQPTHRVFLSGDGSQICVRLQDPATHDFDNQFVQRPAREELRLAELYACTEYLDLERPHEMKSLLMTMPAQLTVSQLALLLEPDPLTPLIGQASELYLLDDARVAGRDCRRVRLVTDGGAFTFWIDRQQKLLRRIEYPLPAATTTDDNDRQPQLVSDYVSVAADGPLHAARFDMPPPPTAEIVRHFVLPPVDPAADKLGRAIPSFELTGLDNTRRAAGPGMNKISVLLWFGHQAPNRTVMSQLLRVHRQFKDNERVQFRAICVEPSTAMSHDDVHRLAARWSVTVPVLRDLDAVGLDVFAISQTPALVVTDEQDRLQLLECGLRDGLADQLPTVLEKLLAGEDLAAAYLKFVETRRREYRQQLAAASVELPEISVELTPAAVAKESEPQHLKRHMLWRNAQLKRPGNLLVTKDPSRGARVVALDGWNHIAELALDGTIERRQQLAGPETLAISKLGTAVNGAGRRRYLALSAMAPQVFVYDDDWQLVTSYPPLTQKHPGIQDGTLADLDGDGRLELYVGFAGVLGVHRVELDGSTAWRERRVADVISLAVAPDRSGQRYLLVTSVSGDIVPLDAAGNLQQPISAGGSAIHQLVAGDARQGNGEFCGVTILAAGNLRMVGLDRRLRESWQYPLPTGAYSNQCRRITGMIWDEPPRQFWLFCGPDSSLHIVSHDAAFHDHFNLGVPLGGATAARVGQRNLLLTSTPKGVTAWDIRW